MRRASSVQASLFGFSGRYLAAIPLGVALLFGALMLPRAAVPDALPMPRVDGRAVHAVILGDRALAADVGRSGPLPDDTRLLGSALRDFHRAETSSRDETMYEKRVFIDRATRTALEKDGVDAVLRLRATMLESFVREVHAYEKSGIVSDELVEVGGNFVTRMAREGWLRNGRLVPRETAWRVMWKQMFQALLGLSDRPAFSPSPDELKHLYAFFLRHPHPPEAARAMLETGRKNATSKLSCDAMARAEERAKDAWRLDRITKLSAVDPSYPLHYARGILHYRRGSFSEAVAAFRAHLATAPTGPYALRAEAYLRASARAAAP